MPVEFDCLCHLSGGEQPYPEIGRNVYGAEVYLAGAAFSSILVSAITGFHAPVFSGPVHWFPLSVLLFVLIFPTVVSYLLVPIGLKYLKTTVVAIYGYLILMVATIVSLLVGQDRFSWAQTIAIGMICISVYLVEVAETKEKPLSNSDKPGSLLRMDREFVTCRLVQCPLPPVVEVAERVYQSLSSESGGTEVKDRDLLSGA